MRSDSSFSTKPRQAPASRVEAGSNFISGLFRGMKTLCDPFTLYGLSQDRSDTVLLLNDLSKDHFVGQVAVQVHTRLNAFDQLSGHHVGRRVDGISR